MQNFYTLLLTEFRLTYCYMFDMVDSKPFVSRIGFKLQLYVEIQVNSALNLDKMEVRITSVQFNCVQIDRI